MPTVLLYAQTWSIFHGISTPRRSLIMPGSLGCLKRTFYRDFFLCLMCLSLLLSSHSVRSPNIIGFKLNISPINRSPGQCLCEGRHMFSMIRHYLSGLAVTAWRLHFNSVRRTVRESGISVRAFPGPLYPVEMSWIRSNVPCKPYKLSTLCREMERNWPRTVVCSMTSAAEKKKTLCGLNSLK